MIIQQESGTGAFLEMAELSYTYYADGSVASVTDSSSLACGNNSGQTAYSYDALGDTVFINLFASGPPIKVATFSYNAAGQPTASALTCSTGWAPSWSRSRCLHGVLLRRDGRVTSVSHTGIDTFTYQYDPAGNVTHMSSSVDGTTNYTLDNADELTSASLTGESYSFDQNGNRTGGGYQTGADNRLLSDGVYTYQYDEEGNRIGGFRFPRGNHAVYVGLREPADGGNFRNARAVPTQVVTYTYDYAGRMIRGGAR